MNLTEGRQSSFTLPFLIVVSAFGIVISLILANVPTSNGVPYQSLAVGTAFLVVCVSGILAALFPSFCSAISQFGKRKTVDSYVSEARRIILRAHHPSCRNYSTHILTLGKTEFCATCSGLLIGAVIAVVGTVTYFFAGFTLANPEILAWIGSAGVALGFLQSGFPKLSTGRTRFLTSIVFVFGTFVLLASIDSATKSVALDLFFVALSVLWILTKIALSQRDHYLTCSECTLEHCVIE
jgi:hypothetical protein